ncbi:MAG: DEAD/DEAH box helicase [Chloroflexi bacterium]|nr:DEAD/DEAH box helicase [Chloroflexota bacterium]
MTNEAIPSQDAVIDENIEDQPGVETVIVEPENRMPEVTMSDLPQRLLDATARAGWTKLTRVQSKAMPYLMAGQDIMVQSHTGSGKTGAFLMPIMELVNMRLDACQALVLVPTRELALQVAKDANTLAGDSGMRTIAVYGGVKYGPQLDAFRKGAHLVVGTPGRVLDHLLRRSLTLDKLKVFIMDEADRMLSMGFYPDMRHVQEYLPNTRLHACMFSATFPLRVQSLARQFMTEPEFLSLSRDQVHVVETNHVFYRTPGLDKDRSLVRIIEVENPDSAIIFCNTKTRVNYVSTVLRRFGYDAAELSGDVAQNERERVMGRLKDGKLRFLVATDVAARGIDISKLSHVIQYEIPPDPEVYIHRAGRTGRAGATGEAVTFVGNFAEQTQLDRIAKQYGIDMQERPLPTDDDVTAVVSERTTVLLEAKLRDRDKLKAERMRRFMPLVESLANDEAGAALIAMLLDDYYQESLHNPPSLPEPTRPKSDRKPKGKGRRRGGRSRSRRGGRRD